MCFDEARGECVLFDLGETWTWDGTSWTLVATSGPSVRWEQAMTYDSARARVVLFGGRDASTVFGDTWEWDGVAWSTVATSGPEPRHGSALVFRPGGSSSVLFGGLRNDGAPLDDTWDWNGTAWSQRSLPFAPAPRAYHAMARSSPNFVQLFGGSTDPSFSGEIFSDNWRIAAGSWDLSYPCALGTRAQAAMIYDVTKNRIVLFGGTDYDSLQSSETWEFNGSWKVIALEGPSPRRSMAMAYDSLRGRTVLFGGITDSGPSAETWEYVPVAAPGAPSDVVVTEVRKGVAALTWVADPFTAANTVVERERLDGVTWTETTTTGIVAPGPVQELDLPGTGTFRYRLRATSCAGTSAWSPDVIVLPAPPGSPGGSLLSRRTAAFSWADRSDFEANYEVQRERSTGGFNGPWTGTITFPPLPANATAFSDRPGPATWRYRIRALNAGGGSDWSSWFVIQVR